MGFSIIKKISLSVVLGLGVGVTAFACLKISSLHALSNEDFTCEHATRRHNTTAWFIRDTKSTNLHLKGTTPRLTIWTM